MLLCPPPEAGKTQLKSALTGKFDPVSEALAALGNQKKKIWQMHTSKNRADCKKELLQKQFAVLRASVEEGLKVTVPVGVEGLSKIRIFHLIDSGGQPAFFAIHTFLAASRTVYLPRALPAGRPHYQSR